MTVLRGKSDDAPPITMRIEQGRLVPVSAFDSELLQQWREGAVLNVSPVLVSVRPLERKYFAMLSKLIKEADTPWTNTDSAHEGMKLAAGFITPYKKKSGAWGAHPRSITTFTDAELSEFFELFCGIIRERFGVDPDTLGREASDTNGVALSSVDHDSRDPDGAPGADPIPVSVGVHSATAPATFPASAAPEAGGGAVTPHDPSSAEGALPRQDLEWLKTAARMLVAATEPGGDTGIVDRQVMTIKQFLTPGTISQAAKDKAQLIYRHCRTSTRENQPIDKIWVARTAQCTIDDLRPEAR